MATKAAHLVTRGVLQDKFDVASGVPISRALARYWGGACMRLPAPPKIKSPRQISKTLVVLPVQRGPIF